jgi:hypothetical protein
VAIERQNDRLQTSEGEGSTGIVSFSDSGLSAEPTQSSGEISGSFGVDASDFLGRSVESCFLSDRGQLDGS